jgi:hypothetical protein
MRGTICTWTGSRSRPAGVGRVEDSMAMIWSGGGRNKVNRLSVKSIVRWKLRSQVEKSNGKRKESRSSLTFVAIFITFMVFICVAMIDIIAHHITHTKNFPPPPPTN